ncbi:type IVB secretion system protein IcmH/DotU [Aestuariibius sp. 2305UL40-4]|uniref:type IVB secretion system protein IcmH/DotU n=1 Tax=Aestuariibius violaceus TaxID=3234132 RepID=UPI00345E563D
MGSDDEKTVFGGKLPQPGQAPKPADGDKTIIGGALPTPGPGRVAQTGQGFQPSRDDTWLGGSVPVQPRAPQPQQPAPSFGGYPQSQTPGGIGRPGTTNEGFFPEIGGGQEAPMQQTGPKIPLQDALKGAGLGAGGSSNPLVAAAANLLILLGRLRTGLVEMQAVPLMEHVTRELDNYTPNAIAAGADPQEAEIAKYALCGTADDIVQNLPGADRGIWIQYSMVARFFGKRDSGVGFFQEAEKAMQAPGQRYQLLELMLMCLSLGFEGQYRTAPNGAVELARIRNAIYETLRRVNPRPDEDISVNWSAVPLAGKRRFSGPPVWVIAAVAAVMLVGAFATLSTLLARDGGQVAVALNELHAGVPAVSLERLVQAQFVPQAPDSTQLERIRERLADRIAAGEVEVGTKGDYIYVRVGNLLLFDSGQATVKEEFATLAAEIAQVLNDEPGPIRVLGFTDNIPMSGRGRYKTNLDLSQARAQGVADVLAGSISDPDRIQVEGRGPADEIADNATPEGRALNRRVEVLIAKEGTF